MRSVVPPSFLVVGLAGWLSQLLFELRNTVLQRGVLLKELLVVLLQALRDLL